MPDHLPPKPAHEVEAPRAETLPSCDSPAAGEDEMLCERCGKAGMYRMHAVWRCPECGFKTDCCGW
jgi:hypothetical protein